MNNGSRRALSAFLKTIVDNLKTLAQSGFEIEIEHRSVSEGWHVVIRTPVPVNDPRWSIYGEGDDLDFEEAVRIAVTQLATSKTRFEVEVNSVLRKPQLRLVRGTS